MPIHARKRWVTCCPVLNAVLLRYRNQQYSLQYRLSPRCDWRNPFARLSPSSDSRRSAPSPRCPNSCLCGSCCRSIHGVLVILDAQRLRTAYPDLSARSTQLLDFFAQSPSATPCTPRQPAWPDSSPSPPLCANADQVQLPSTASRFRCECR